MKKANKKIEKIITIEDNYNVFSNVRPLNTFSQFLLQHFFSHGFLDGDKCIRLYKNFFKANAENLSSMDILKKMVQQIVHLNRSIEFLHFSIIKSTSEITGKSIYLMISSHIQPDNLTNKLKNSLKSPLLKTNDTNILEFVIGKILTQSSKIRAMKFCDIVRQYLQFHSVELEKRKAERVADERHVSRRVTPDDVKSSVDVLVKGKWLESIESNDNVFIIVGCRSLKELGTKINGKYPDRMKQCCVCREHNCIIGYECENCSAFYHLKCMEKSLKMAGKECIQMAQGKNN
ncbi:hypothetical protein SNEBB_008089 [Seison nebaliae]|nr:hypothetical protein SNEBB_008089 [Seison nebaliae]